MSTVKNAKPHVFGPPTTVPEVTFDLRLPAEDMARANPFRWEPTDTAELFGGRRVVVFGCPGTIEPGCTACLLLDYEARYGSFRQAGIDAVYCISVNDAPVVFQWAYGLDIWNVLMLPDGNAEFTSGMGMLAREGVGNTRTTTRAYAAIVDDRRIERVFTDAGSARDCGSNACGAVHADTVLAWLRSWAPPRTRAPSWRHPCL